jgi:hypothetical protein
LGIGSWKDKVLKQSANVEVKQCKLLVAKYFCVSRGDSGRLTSVEVALDA